MGTPKRNMRGVLHGRTNKRSAVNLESGAGTSQKRQRPLTQTQSPRSARRSPRGLGGKVLGNDQCSTSPAEHPRSLPDDAHNTIQTTPTTSHSGNADRNQMREDIIAPGCLASTNDEDLTQSIGGRCWECCQRKGRASQYRQREDESSHILSITPRVDRQGRTHRQRARSGSNPGLR